MSYYGWDIHQVALNVSVKSVNELYFYIGKQLNKFQDTWLDINDFVSRMHTQQSEHVFAIGNGVLLPNALLAGLEENLRFFIRLKYPLDIGAPDGKPIRNIFCYYSPQQEGPLHLRALSRISRQLNDHEFLNQLEKMDGESAIRSLFMYPEEFDQTASVA